MLGHSNDCHDLLLPQQQQQAAAIADLSPQLYVWPCHIIKKKSIPSCHYKLKTIYKLKCILNKKYTNVSSYIKGIDKK